MNIDFSASKATGEPHDSKAIQEKLEETKNESKHTEQLSMKSSIIDSYSNTHTQLNEKLESSIKKAEPNQEASIGINMAKSEFYNLKEKINQEDVQVPKILRNLTAKKKKENPRTTVHCDN
jgi:16S rRNA C1402 N4-methylase RsmH